MSQPSLSISIQLKFPLIVSHFWLVDPHNDFPFKGCVTATGIFNFLIGGENHLSGFLPAKKHQASPMPKDRQTSSRDNFCDLTRIILRTNQVIKANDGEFGENNSVSQIENIFSENPLRDIVLKAIHQHAAEYKGLTGQ